MSDRTLLDNILDGIVEAIATRTAELVISKLPESTTMPATEPKPEPKPKPKPEPKPEPKEEPAADLDTAQEIDPADALAGAQTALGKLINARKREGAVALLKEFGVAKLSQIKDVGKLVEFAQKAYANAK